VDAMFEKSVTADEVVIRSADRLVPVTGCRQCHGPCRRPAAVHAEVPGCIAPAAERVRRAITSM
jgi:hypothetical protein